MDKYELVEILEELVLMRFKTKEEIKTHLQNCFNEFKENIKISDIENKTRYDDEEHFDFNLIGSIDNKNFLVDFDLYYLIDNQRNMIITEIGYEYQ